jgi:hypothetical protein
MPVTAAKIDGRKVKSNKKVSPGGGIFFDRASLHKLLNALGHNKKSVGKKTQKKVARPEDE